ncbi:MAG: hypothetical protein ACREON_02255 [Gemmatimonadaceae bacterium]
MKPSVRYSIGYGGVAIALMLHASDVLAQRRPPTRREQTIEIRGQVPTPQVVTVRPRDVPAYSRQVLVPRFYDRTFWPSILPAYQIVPMRQIGPDAPLDTVPEVVARVPEAAVPAPGAPPGPPGAAPADTAPVASESLEREIEAIRQELARRRARLDSLEEAIRRMGRPADTLRRRPR